MPLNPLFLKLSKVLLSLVFWGVLSTGAKGEALGLSGFLDWAEGRSIELRSINKRIEATRTQESLVDLDISPSFSANMSELWDDREEANTNSASIDREGGFSLTSPTIIGTRFSLESDYTKRESSNTFANGSHEWDWAFQISQPLLRDFFGRGFRLKRRASLLDARAAHARALYERAKVRLRLEHLYYDYLLLHLERLAHESNLARSKEMTKWVRSRLARSAAEKTDLFQVESLMAKRELELQNILDLQKKLELQLKQAIEFETLPELSLSADEFKRERDARALVEGFSSSQTPLRRESLARIIEAEAEIARTKSLEDSALPQLDALGRVGTNAIRSEFGESFRRSFDNRYYELGLQFSTNLNFAVLFNLKKTTRLRSEALQNDIERERRDSKLAWADYWDELNRFRERCKTANRLAEAQKKKSLEEARRFRQGRTTAFQAISFEQEATDAELLALELEAQLKKRESEARLFVVDRGMN